MVGCLAGDESSCTHLGSPHIQILWYPSMAVPGRAELKGEKKCSGRRESRSKGDNPIEATCTNGYPGLVVLLMSYEPLAANERCRATVMFMSGLCQVRTL